MTLMAVAADGRPHDIWLVVVARGDALLGGAFTRDDRVALS
jgi:hypothetical protein